MITENGEMYSDIPSSNEFPEIARFMVKSLRGQGPEIVSAPVRHEEPSFTTFATMLDQLVASSPELKNAVEEMLARSARQTVAFGDGPMLSTEEFLEALRVPAVRTRGGTFVRGDWWGFVIRVSHEDLGNFLASAVPINLIGSTLAAGIWPPAAPFIGLAAAFIAGSLELLRSLDRGQGVDINMSWFAVGAFVPTRV